MGSEMCIRDRRSIEKELDVNPGDINYRVDIMEWLLHASREIILTDDVFSDEQMIEIAEIVKLLDVLRLRVRHGCKEDLLSLVNIPNVGRMRARELSKMGIRTPNDVANMTRKQISEVLKMRGWGPQLLDKIILEVSKVLTKSAKKSSKLRQEIDRMRLLEDHSEVEAKRSKSSEDHANDVDSAADDVQDSVDISTPTPAASTAQSMEYVPRRSTSSWGLGIGLGTVAAAIIFYVLTSDQGSKFFPNIQQKLVGALHLSDTASIVPYRFDEDGGLR